MHHIVTIPSIFSTLHCYLGTCISYIKSKNTKFTLDRAATGKTLCFVTLTYGSRTANRTDSLDQTVNGLVGNVDWEDFFTVVTYEFPGPNRIGTRRRAASAWLAVERCFLRLPYQQIFEACNLTQVLTDFGYTSEVKKPVLILRCSLLRLLFL